MQEYNKGGYQKSNPKKAKVKDGYRPKLKRFPTILREMPRHFAGNAARIDADSWGCSDTFISFSVQYCEAFRQKPGEIAAASEKKPEKLRKMPGELPGKAEECRGNSQSFPGIFGGKRGEPWRNCGGLWGKAGGFRVKSASFSGKNLGRLGDVLEIFLPRQPVAFNCRSRGIGARSKKFLTLSLEPQKKSEKTAVFSVFPFSGLVLRIQQVR